VIAACVVAPTVMQAQGRAGGAPPTAKAAAPIDLTGYWTAVVTEDWHVRMLTPSKGDFGSGVAGTIENPGVGFVGAGPNPAAQGNIPYTTAGAQAAMKWDPVKDEAEGRACNAYGAPGIMRLPTHLHITWQDESTLKIEADYGTQTRLLHFGPATTEGRLDYSNATLFPSRPLQFEPPATVEPSLQGYSIASWTIMGGNGGFADRVLPHDGVTRSQCVDPVHGDRRRPRVPDPAMDRQLRVQETAGRFEMESDSLFREVITS
jgi:hypothetical protein